MKKSLIALAVAAGTIAGAQAADTTTLYGSVGFSSTIAKTDDLGFKDVKDGIKDNVWDIETATAKIGVKGTEELDNGLQAFFNLEGNLDGKKMNYAYLGLKGDFGTLTIGQQKSLFKVVTDNGVFEQVDTTKGDYPGTEKKVISYVSPAASGLTFGASVMADKDNGGSKGADAWEAAAFYNLNGFDIGGVYTNAKEAGNGNTEYLGLNVGFGNDVYSAVGRVRHTSSTATEYTLEGEYNAGTKNTFRAGIGYYDAKDANAKKGDQYTYALGYKYNFSERTYTWVEGQYDDVKAKGKDDGFKALVGIRHDF